MHCLIDIKTIGQSLGSILIFGVHILMAHSNFAKRNGFFLNVGVKKKPLEHVKSVYCSYFIISV